MLKDITLGQYFPGESVVHRMDSRAKILLTIVYIVMLFIANNVVGLGLSVLFAGLLYVIAKIPMRMILRSLKPVIPIVVFTAVLNMFFVQGEGQPLFSWWIFKLYKEGLYTAGFMAVRIVCLIAGTSLLTYTTSPITLTDGIESLLKPLEKIHFPAHELAMMMTIALRFIPTLIEETDKIISAQKARGADLDSGNLMQKVKSLIPILIPLFVSAFRRADELALAMECRCYRGGSGRTRMRQMKLGAVDAGASVVLLVSLAAVIATNFLIPAVI